MQESTRPRRIDWYIRVIPVILLAALYFLIAYSKIASGIDYARSGVGDAGWSTRALSLTYAASGAMFFVTIGAMMLFRKEPIRRERRLIGWLMPIAVTVSFAVVGGAPLQDYSNTVMLVATVLVVIGTGFTVYALRYLGRHFGVVSDVRGLVTNGPYRWVRHPLYAGETITLIGLAIAVATPVMVTVFLIGLGLQLWRAKIEEQSLSAAFPEYKDYAARTPMLIPFTRLSPRSMPVVPVVEHQR